MQKNQEDKLFTAIHNAIHKEGYVYANEGWMIQACCYSLKENAVAYEINFPEKCPYYFEKNRLRTSILIAKLDYQLNQPELKGKEDYDLIKQDLLELEQYYTSKARQI